MSLDTLTTTPRPVVKTRRWPHPAWLLLLLIPALGVWVWLSTPATVKEVSRYPMVGDTLCPTATGFFYQQSDTTYSLRRWDGRTGWTVTLPAVFSRPGLPSPRLIASSANRVEICVSPDGHYFAAVLVRDATTLYLWREGTEVGHVSLPVVQSFDMLMCNDGRAFLLCSSSTATTLVLVKDGKVAARGTVPSDSQLTPDGTRLVVMDGARFTVADVRIAAGKITLGKFNTEPGDYRSDPYYRGAYTIPGLYQRGTILTVDGAVHRPDKPIDAAWTGWDPDTTISPDSRYTLLMKNRQVRVLAPATGDTWAFQAPSTMGGDVTDNGRFVMLWCRREVPEPLRPLLDLMPDGREEEYVAIFERPGRFRAVLRKRDFNSWWISPDGHAIAAGDGTHVRLFRW